MGWGAKCSRSIALQDAAAAAAHAKDKLMQRQEKLEVHIWLVSNCFG
jgi:hypothetical protein